MWQDMNEITKEQPKANEQIIQIIILENITVFRAVTTNNTNTKRKLALYVEDAVIMDTLNFQIEATGSTGKIVIDIVYDAPCVCV